MAPRIIGKKITICDGFMPEALSTVGNDDAAHLLPPLHRASRAWFQNTNPDVEFRFLNALGTVLADSHDTISYGTAFSGSDIMVHTLAALSETWQELYGLRVSFVQKFA
jgi:hypothetical protein